MWCNDFEFDGELASSHNLILCSFDGGGTIETSPNGADISFHTIKTPGDNEWKYICSQYDEVLSSTFQVMKKSCKGQNNKNFSVSEQRAVNRWLSRNDGFHKLKLIKDGYENIYFEAQLKVKKIELGCNVVGFEISVTTNKPYANFEEKEFSFTGTTYSFEDISDEIGYQYPYMEIEVESDGNLEISNSQSKYSFVINNCTNGEKITIDNKNHIISSSLRNVDVINDFNFKWFKIENKKNNKMNTLTLSLPCSVHIKYTPICKVGL